MLKKDIKFILECKSQVACDLKNTVALQNTNKTLFAIIKTPTFQLYKAIGECDERDFAFEYDYLEFIEKAKKIHGTQHMFEVHKDGLIEVYKKKTGESLEIIDLKPQPISPAFFPTTSGLANLPDKKTLLNLIKSTKRYQCHFDYFTGFNEASLISGESLYVFATDGIHSLRYNLSEYYGVSNAKMSYHISMDSLSVLEVFMRYSGEGFNFNIIKDTLVVMCPGGCLRLKLQDNDDVDEDVINYFFKSKGDCLISLDEEKKEEILNFFSRNYLSQYRKEHDIKESLELYLEIDNSGISLKEENVLQWNLTHGFRLKKRICLYHFIEFIKAHSGVIEVYEDRIISKDYNSILYL